MSLIVSILSASSTGPCLSSPPLVFHSLPRCSTALYSRFPQLPEELLSKGVGIPKKQGLYSFAQRVEHFLVTSIYVSGSKSHREEFTPIIDQQAGASGTPRQYVSSTCFPQAALPSTPCDGMLVWGDTHARGTRQRQCQPPSPYPGSASIQQQEPALLASRLRPGEN